MEEITYGDNSCYGAVKRSLGKAWKAQNLSFTEVGVGKSKTKHLMVAVAAFDEMCKKEMISEFINLQAEKKGVEFTNLSTYWTG